MQLDNKQLGKYLDILERIDKKKISKEKLLNFYKEIKDTEYSLLFIIKRRM